MLPRDGRVTRLDLNDNHLVGALPPELRALRHLTDLLLDHNGLGGQVSVLAWACVN
jgi:hypothetical protein